MRAPIITALVFYTTLIHASPAGVRSVYLNGVDISSAKSQDLHNVDIHINEAGEIFIVAPHYQVNEEDTFVPLAKYVRGMNVPEHKPPQKIGEDQKVTQVQKVEPGQPIPKAGEPLSPPAQMQTVNAPPPKAAGEAPPAAPKPVTVDNDPPPPPLPGDDAEPLAK